jgi:hypothetical protein
VHAPIVCRGKFTLTPLETLSVPYTTIIALQAIGITPQFMAKKKSVAVEEGVKTDGADMHKVCLKF